MNINPDWTERLDGAGDHQGRWPLGLEAMGFRISRELLPALTNTTRRARYYSFLAWAHWTFARKLRDQGKSETTHAEQKAWRNRLENALRTATLLDPAYTHGLIGRNSAIPLPDDPRAPYPIDTRVKISAWQAEYYKPSWMALGLGGLKGDVVIVDPGTGALLAKAFDERVRRQDPTGELYARLISDDTSVPAGVIQVLGPGLSIRGLDATEPERQLLVERMFHLQVTSNPDARVRSDWTRSASLTLLLDMIAAGNGEFVSAETAHRLFATGQFSSGRTYTPPPSLRFTLAKWQRYQERQQQKIALSGLWHETLMSIRNSERGRATGAAIHHRIEACTGEAEIVRRWLGADALSSRIDSALARLSSQLPDAVLIEGLAQELTDYLRDTTRQDQAGAALLLLLVLAHRWSIISSGLPPEVVAVFRAAQGELPPPWTANEILSRPQLTLRQLVAHIVERWVLGQSLRVALGKWADGQDRFFVARDEDGYRIVRKQDPHQYLAYDPPRIDSSIEVLEDLALLERDNGLRLTSLGEALREEALSFHNELDAELRSASAS